MLPPNAQGCQRRIPANAACSTGGPAAAFRLHVLRRAAPTTSSQKRRTPLSRGGVCQCAAVVWDVSSLSQWLAHPRDSIYDVGMVAPSDLFAATNESDPELPKADRLSD